jgi:lysophospholipase L1-like esterase
MTMRIAFLGASLIAGTISAPLPPRVVSRLGRDDIQVLNAGVNGDLAWNVARRAPAVIAWKPDLVFIMAGTNDVLASLTESRARRYRRWKKLPQAPDAQFSRDSLNSLFDAVRTVPLVIVGTLPPLGEDLDGDVCARVRTLNELIARAASERGWVVADIYTAIAARIGSGGRPLPTHDYLVVSAALRRHILRRSYESIARTHGFRALSDGIHFTEGSADAAADVIVSAMRRAGLVGA